MLKDITLRCSDIHVCCTWEERWKMELLVLREKNGNVLSPMLRLRPCGEVSWIFKVSASYFFLFLIEGLVGEYLREVSFFSQFLTSGRNCDFSSSSSASNPKCSRVQMPEFV